MRLTRLVCHKAKQTAFVNGGVDAPFISTVEKCYLFCYLNLGGCGNREKLRYRK